MPKETGPTSELYILTPKARHAHDAWRVDGSTTLFIFRATALYTTLALAAEREAAEARGREAAFAVLDAAIIRLHNMITEDVPPDDDPDDHVPTLHLAIHRDVLGTWRAVLDDGRATPPDAVRDTPSAALTVLAAAALDADADATREGPADAR